VPIPPVPPPPVPLLDAVVAAPPVPPPPVPLALELALDDAAELDAAVDEDEDEDEDVVAADVVASLEPPAPPEPVVPVPVVLVPEQPIAPAKPRLKAISTVWLRSERAITEPPAAPASRRRGIVEKKKPVRG